nr:hypothetical protein [Xanthomonas cannabis]
MSVLWVLLPFAVFGIKRLLTQALEEQRRTNDLLEQLLASPDQEGFYRVVADERPVSAWEAIKEARRKD